MREFFRSGHARRVEKKTREKRKIRSGRGLLRNWENKEKAAPESGFASQIRVGDKFTVYIRNGSSPDFSDAAT